MTLDELQEKLEESRTIFVDGYKVAVAVYHEQQKALKAQVELSELSRDAVMALVRMNLAKLFADIEAEAKTLNEHIPEDMK